MATIQNDNDVLLQATSPRVITTADESLSITASSPIFTIDILNNITPLYITLNANLVNMTGVVTWSCVGGTLSGNSSTLTTPTTNIAYMIYTEMSAENAVVTATFTDAGGTVFTATYALAVIAPSGSAQVFAYQRSASVPTLLPGNITWTFATGAITTPTPPTLANGWSTTIPSGANPLYICFVVAVGSGATVNILNAQWSAPALFAQNGQQSTIASLYKWAVSSPSVPSTTPSVWTWSSRTFSVGVSGWTTTPGAVVTGQTLWALNCTITDTATNTTTNFDWDTGVISAVAFPGVAGATGATGSTGSTGSTGNSACIAYSAVVGGSGALSGSPSTDTTTGITSLPATNTWGGSETWSTAQPGISAGYSLWQTNGIYSVATNQIVWGAPYLSSLKVGTLSAITANCGSITSGTITGTLIETSASYPNVVIDGSSNDIVINNASGVAIITLNGVATNPLIAEANIVYPVAYIQNTSTNSAGYALEATGNGGVGVYGYSTSSIAGFFQAGSARDAVQLDGGITPFANNAFNLGYSGASWSGIWSQTAVVVTSDERTKTDIRDSNIGLQFILDLKPIMYKHIVGLNIPTRTRDEPTKENPQPKIKVSYSPIPGIRNHYGLSAQQVKATMSKHGLDDAAFWTLEDKTDSNSQQALRYEEFLSPIIKAVQEQQALILDLTNRLIVLENKK